MSIDELDSVLSDFGLSDTERAVYRAVLESGDATVSTAAEKADVSSRHVYEIAVELERWGLVKVSDHLRPTIIEARSAEMIREQLNETIDTLQASLDRHAVLPTPVKDDHARERLVDLLERFGFSKKEAAIYTATFQCEDASVRNVAEIADVSLRYAYDLSESLEERGFVRIDEQPSPRTVRPIDPAATAETFRENVDKLCRIVDNHYSTVTTVDRQFEVIKSRTSVVNRLRDRIADAEKEVVLSLAFPFIEHIEDALRAAVDRDVLVVLLLTDVSPDEVEADRFDGVASVVRVRPLVTPMMVSIDESLGIVPPRQVVAWENTEMQALETQQDTLATPLRLVIMNTFWPPAFEVYADDSVSVPWTTDYFHHGVFHATRHLHQGSTPRVQIQARPQGTDEPLEPLRGRVIETRQYLLEPLTNTIPVESMMVVETEDETVTVGGPDAGYEDYHGHSVTLEPPR